MFIVWGKKRVVRTLGYVADFCQICRGVRPFKLQRIGLASHIYYIAAGEGDLICYEKSCRHCKTTVETELSRYASVAKKATAVAQLEKETFPDLRQVLQARLALEERVKQAPEFLSSEERRTLVLQPFMALSPTVQKHFSTVQMDAESTLALGAGIAILVGGPMIASNFPNPNPELTLAIFAAIGLSLILWQMLRVGRRFMCRKIVPLLADALRPLKPSDHELTCVLAEFKQHQHKIGSKLRLADLRVHM